MPKKLFKVYQLDQKDKEIIAAWLHSEIPANEAGAEFGMTRDNFKGMVATIIKKMVTEGSLDISKQLNNY
jgi:hypothetical protein